MVRLQIGARCVFLLAWLFCAPGLRAQLQISTIDDTIFRADGQRFNGIASIEWRSFLASDSTVVSANSKTVRIINGVLKVNLAPTTNASVGAYYLVKYLVNGRLQSTEYWAVRPSSTALKLRDVRLAGPPAGGSAITLPPSSLVQINEVVGLNDELAARPRKGLGFTASRAAVINSAGDIEGAVGTSTDCVRVDGTAGPCGAGGGGTWIDAETPAGLVNGSNSVYTLSNPPSPSASLQLYRNGVLQKAGLDYTLSTNVISFVAGSIPQLGDTMLATYRISGAGAVVGAVGQASGVLAGYYPSPSLAPAVITDLHVASNAAISESKLALNFPTHTSANDPSSDQKAALLGTAGTPANGNRYVTDEDPRMSNARTPTNHGLLGGSHFDTNSGVVARGDLIVGQGTSPALWTRLPLGGASRCLTSNGSDAVWNTCLYAGFPAGSIPFTDGTGNFAHNSTKLFWDNSTRRLGIGVASPSSTLMVYDSASGSGETSVTVRAGQGQQSTTPLQRWQDNASADLARIDSDGVLTAAGVRATTNATRPAWVETGAPADPTTVSDGAMWFNTAENARRSREGGQTHTWAQVICSAEGNSTGATTSTLLGRCRIPAAMVRQGDRFEIRFDVTHAGSSVPFSYTVYWAGVALAARSGAGTETHAAGRVEAMAQSTSLYWNWMNWGSSAAVQAGSGSSGSVPSGDVLVEVFGQMASGAPAETVMLRNLSVLRLPNQINQ